MGDGKKFGRKDMISLQKKLKINLHFSRRQRSTLMAQSFRKASTSASRGFEWEMDGNRRKRFGIFVEKVLDSFAYFCTLISSYTA